VNDPLQNPQVDPLFKNLNTPVPPDPITSAHRFAADYLQERHIEGDLDNTHARWRELAVADPGQGDDHLGCAMGAADGSKFLNSAVPLLLPISLVAPELGVVAGVSAGMAQMGLGVYQHNSGRSSEEREGGLNNVAIGFLNAAMSVFGGETKLATDVNLPETNGGADSAVSMTPSEIQDRAQPDDHGVYHVDDKQYVIYDGKAYQVHV
jgi:hypothetical protein